MGCKAIAAIITVFSTVTTNWVVTATTEGLPERCPSSMNVARHSHTPNIAAAASMWTNLSAKITSSIAGPVQRNSNADWCRSERDFVVHVTAKRTAGGDRGFSGWTRRAETIFVRRGIATRRRSSAVKQSQFAAKTLQHDFRRIAILAGLVLPLARLQGAFNVNL